MPPSGVFRCSTCSAFNVTFFLVGFLSGFFALFMSLLLRLSIGGLHAPQPERRKITDIKELSQYERLLEPPACSRRLAANG